jgi:hypothetical protein
MNVEYRMTNACLPYVWQVEGKASFPIAYRPLPIAFFISFLLIWMKPKAFTEILALF